MSSNTPFALVSSLYTQNGVGLLVAGVHMLFARPNMLKLCSSPPMLLPMLKKADYAISNASRTGQALRSIPGDRAGSSPSFESCGRGGFRGARESRSRRGILKPRQSGRAVWTSPPPASLREFRTSQKGDREVKKQRRYAKKISPGR